MKKMSLKIGIPVFASLFFCLAATIAQAEELSPRNLGLSFNSPKGWKVQNVPIEQGYGIELTHPRMKKVKIKLVSVFGSYSNDLPLYLSVKFLEENWPWPNLERKNITKREIFISGIKGLHEQYDLSHEGKIISHAEIIVATKRNTEYYFSYMAETRKRAQVSKIFREIVNSIRMNELEKMTKTFSNSGANISFDYPSLWPDPIFEKTGSAKFITDTRPMWTIIVLTACYECEIPIGFPVFIQKYDADKFPLSELLVSDKAKVVSETSQKNLKTIKATGHIENTEHDIYYIIRKNEILRMFTHDFTTENLDLLLKNVKF